MGNRPESMIDPNGTTFTGGDAQIAFRDLQNIFGNSTFEEGGFKAGGSSENWETFLSNTMSNPGSYSIESLFANNSDAFMNYIMGGAMWFELATVKVTAKAKRNNIEAIEEYRYDPDRPSGTMTFISSK